MPVLIVFAALAVGTACRSDIPVPIRVEMAGVSPFPPGSFTEIIVTNFREEAALPDFRPGLELQAYLAEQFDRAFDGKVSILAVSHDDLLDPSSWTQHAAGRATAVFVTGSVGLVGQIRKALENKRLPVDSPFKMDGRGLIEQRRWTLTVDLFVISGANGQSLVRKTFREERDYIDLEKPAEFAFSELSDHVIDQLLPLLLPTSTLENRVLLKR